MACKDPEKRREYRRKWWAENTERNREYHHNYRASNYERVRGREIMWAAANPQKIVSTRRKHKYGITTDQRDALFVAQGGVCAACGDAHPGSKSGWHTDHDHLTGKVRGILCQPCNHMLGNAKDDPERLRKAIAYLEVHSVD
jgi:Recombination endonuclease VII